VITPLSSAPAAACMEGRGASTRRGRRRRRPAWCKEKGESRMALLRSPLLWRYLCRFIFCLAVRHEAGETERGRRSLSPSSRSSLKMVQAQETSAPRPRGCDALHAQESACFGMYYRQLSPRVHHAFKRINQKTNTLHITDGRLIIGHGPFFFLLSLTHFGSVFWDNFHTCIHIFALMIGNNALQEF